MPASTAVKGATWAPFRSSQPPPRIALVSTVHRARTVTARRMSVPGSKEAARILTRLPKREPSPTETRSICGRALLQIRFFKRLQVRIIDRSIRRGCDVMTRTG